MIKMIPSFVDALYVANCVINSGELEDCTGHIEAYQNGREQGVLIWAIGGDVSNPDLFISHHRNSDRLVIYEGEYAMQSISEDAWKNCYYSESLEDAVDHVIHRCLAINGSNYD